MFLFINKPAGWTSFDIVNYIRTGIRKSVPSVIRNIKVGHAGTLDPFATGLLIVAVGREQTKRLDEFKKLPKTYVAVLHLGAVSDTYDVTGQISITHSAERKTHDNGQVARYALYATEIPLQEKILETLMTFKGKQLQIPPMYSAKKVGGQRLYKLARKGIEIERKPSEIEIFDIKLVRYSWPLLTIEVACSAGAYIRSLAHDIGQQLGVGAYCEELTRTKIGDYTIEEAQSLDSLVFE